MFYSSAKIIVVLNNESGNSVESNSGFTNLSTCHTSASINELMFINGK